MRRQRPTADPIANGRVLTPYEGPPSEAVDPEPVLKLLPGGARVGRQGHDRRGAVGRDQAVVPRPEDGQQDHRAAAGVARNTVRAVLAS